MAPLAADYPQCTEGHRITCVVDGDTFWLRGEKIRLLDIDAPELHEPRCSAERRLAEQATLRLAELLAGGRLRIGRSGLDQYGRTLAIVRAGGVDVGAQLVAEGLARIWAGHRRPWCGAL